MRIWLALLAASLQAQMSYRGAYLYEAIGRFLTTGLEVVAVFVMFGHVGDLAGWTRWEVVYLFGIANVSLGIAELLCDGLREMPALVRLGGFDGILVRPAPALVQVLGRQCRPMHAGRIVQGAIATACALAALDLSPGPVEAAMLAVNVLASAVVYGAILIASAATCIFTVESSEAFNAFTYGGVQMTQFPVSIYRPWLRHLFLWVIPVGYTSYFPALVVLGKEDVLALPAVMPWLTPLVAGAFLGLTLLYWCYAVDRYRSTGS